jgi:hypothetical protein
LKLVQQSMDPILKVLVLMDREIQLLKEVQ